MTGTVTGKMAALWFTVSQVLNEIRALADVLENDLEYFILGFENNCQLKVVGVEMIPSR